MSVVLPNQQESHSIHNLRVLVDLIPNNCAHRNINNITTPDAIFVPFRATTENINFLLPELKWYEGPIYLMPSGYNDMEIVNPVGIKNIRELRFSQQGFIDFFYSLSTSMHRQTQHLKSTWDLPVKRNYALCFARMKGYKRILIVDDDIQGLNQTLLNTLATSLSDYSLSGCFVDEFPDLSILDHLERIAGTRKYPFLSGSFLFIKPFEVNGFFPMIYNEDWLFMLPYIMENSVCSLGSVAQLAYDPFSDPRKATFQEFGDVVVGGLYELMRLNEYEDRYKLEVWKYIVQERRSTWISMRSFCRGSKYQRVIDAGLKANKTITEKDCLEFVESWEYDLSQWRKFSKEN